MNAYHLLFRHSKVNTALLWDGPPVFILGMSLGLVDTAFLEHRAGLYLFWWVKNKLFFPWASLHFSRERTLHEAHIRYSYICWSFSWSLKHFPQDPSFGTGFTLIVEGLFFFFKFTYLFWERDSVSGRGAEREEGENPKQVLPHQHRARCRAQTHEAMRS